MDCLDLGERVIALSLKVAASDLTWRTFLSCRCVCRSLWKIPKEYHRYERMSQDAFADPGYGQLSDLFDDTPGKYLKSMTRRSHQANALAAGMNDDGSPRRADHALQAMRQVGREAQPHKGF